MSNPNECPRCGATTPHQTFAELAAVNISQEKELTRLRAVLAKAINGGCTWNNGSDLVEAERLLEGRDK